MNETPRQTPPHFVPTLTEVVRLDPVAPPVVAPVAPVAPAMALPAEFAGLLDGWPTGLNASAPAAGELPSLDNLPTEGLPAAVVERILLRVELTLASRLQETVDALVEAQMSSLKADLRAQVSAVVLEAVSHAVRQETQSRKT
jgi:hypothetical protein